MRIMAVPCGVFRKCKWGTQGNGKLTAFASGRPAFQKHAKHAEGSNTTPTSHTRKTMSAGCTNPDFGRSEKDYAAQRGRDAFGTATRISASLFRRLSAFFWSTPGQDPKAAKYAVLTPGPGIFVNVRNGPRVVIPPPSEMPHVSPCEPMCRLLRGRVASCRREGFRAGFGRI